MRYALTQYETRRPQAWTLEQFIALFLNWRAIPNLGPGGNDFVEWLRRRLTSPQPATQYDNSSGQEQINVPSCVPASRKEESMYNHQPAKDCLGAEIRDPLKAEQPMCSCDDRAATTCRVHDEQPAQHDPLCTIVDSHDPAVTKCTLPSQPAQLAERQPQQVAERSLGYAAQLQQLIENLKYPDTPTPHAHLWHHKMIVEAKQRIAEAEAKGRREGIEEVVKY